MEDQEIAPFARIGPAQADGDEGITRQAEGFAELDAVFQRQRDGRHGIVAGGEREGAAAISSALGEWPNIWRKYFARVVPETAKLPLSPASTAPRSSQPKWLTSSGMTGPLARRPISSVHFASGRPERFSRPTAGPWAAMAAAAPA